MASAGTVTIDVDARTAKFEEGMSRASRTAERESKKIQTQAVAMGSAIGTMFGNVVSSVASGVVRMTANAIRAANDIGEFSSKVGVSVETLSALRREAGLSGTNFDQLKRGIVQMSTAASTNNVAFKAMGINTKDANGHLKTSEQLLTEVATKFAGYQDGAAKTALAQRVFGKSGAELIPMLNQLGNEGLAGVIEKTREAGALMSGDGVTGAKQFTDTINELHTQADDFGQSLARELTPALNDAAKLFKDPEFKKSVDGIAESIGFVASKAVDAARSLAEMYNKSQSFLGFASGSGVYDENSKQAAQIRLDALTKAKHAVDNNIFGRAFTDVDTSSPTAMYESLRARALGGGEDLSKDIAKTQAEIAHYDAGLFKGVIGGVVSPATASTSPTKANAPVISDYSRSGGRAAAAAAKQADSAQQRLAAQVERLQGQVEGPATAAWNTYAKAVRDAAADGAKMIQGGKDVSQVQAQVQEAVTAAGDAWKKYQTDAEKAFNNEMADVTSAIGGQTKEMDQVAQATRNYDRALQSLTDRLANGTINQAQFNRGTAEYKALLDKQVDDIKNANDEVNQFALQAARSIQSNIADTFYDMYKGVKGGMNGILQSWGDMILKMLAQAQAAQLAKALFGDYGNTGKLGGIIGGVIQGWMGYDATGGAGTSTYNSMGGVTHVDFGGGRAGGGPTKAGSLYEVAEGGRPELYHTDGRTYLLSGSDGQVTPARSGRAVAAVGAGGGGMEVEINITNNGQAVEGKQTGQRMDGKKMIIDMVLQAVQSDIAKGGGTAQAMQQRFGLQRRGTPVSGG
jgi:hypothetical protein